LSGTVEYDQADLTKSKVQLTFPIDSLVIDDAELREQEGEDFPGAVPDKDIIRHDCGARRNYH
jgi:polyisoprenoid-binding protein YceI